MRSAVLFLLALTAIVHLPAAAVLPSVVSAAQLDNTCQCECCYQVSDYQTECLSPSDAFFEVPTCSHCTVSECSSRFPTPCSQPSSVVHAKCNTEHTAFFRLVPALFVIATIALLIYGFFFKKFDGYHREQGNNPPANQSRRYNTFRNDSDTSNPTETTKLLPRNSPNRNTLPTINEEEETPSDKHSSTSTSPQDPPPSHDDSPPAQPPQSQDSSAPLMQDDADLDARISEVATIDSDSTYARDLPFLSEIPQPDAFDADAHPTSFDVQHAAEANPSAIFERDVSDIAQLHSEVPHVERKEQSAEADLVRESEETTPTEGSSAAELTAQVVNTETIGQLDLKPDPIVDDETSVEDAQTAHVESQPIERAVDIVKTTEGAEAKQGTFEDQTPNEGQVEPGLLDATEDTSGIAGSPVREALDIVVESLPPPQLTAASRTVEELDTSMPEDPEPVIADVPVDVDENVIVPSETAADSDAVARTTTSAENLVVESEMKPAKDASTSETPLNTTPDEGIEETVETENETIVNVNDEPSNVDTDTDTTAERIQPERIEPTDTAPVSEIQTEPSTEDMAQRREQDVPSEVTSTEEGLQELPANDEDHPISPPKTVESTDPITNVVDTVEEMVPDPVPLSENDSTKVVEAATATEMSPETSLDIDVLQSVVDAQKEGAEVGTIEKSEVEDLKPFLDTVKGESDDSEQGEAFVEDIPKGQECVEVSGYEQESPSAEVSETVLESQEVTDSSDLVDDKVKSPQTETLPPSDAQEGSNVKEPSIEENATAIELDLLKATELAVEERAVTAEEVDTIVSDHQDAHLEILPEADDVTVEVEQSQIAEAIENEQLAIGEQDAEADAEPMLAVPGAEAEAPGVEEIEPVEPSTGLAERDLEVDPSQVGETRTSDGATSKDAILESSNDDGDRTNNSEANSHDLDTKEALSDFAKEPTDSLTTDHGSDRNAPDIVAKESEGTFSEEAREQADQPEVVEDEVTGQSNESESHGSEVLVPDSTAGEPVVDDVDAAGFEQSTIQQETDQSAVNESIDVEPFISGAAEAEKDDSLDNDTELETANTETTKLSLSESEDAEQQATTTHDFSELETKPEASDSNAEELDAAESPSCEPDDGSLSAMILEAAEPEAVTDGALESGENESGPTKNEVTEVEAKYTTITKPLNLGPTPMESASAAEAIVERGGEVVAEGKNVVTTNDEAQVSDQDTERHSTNADSTSEATTDLVNVEPILDEARNSEQEAHVELLAATDASGPIVESSTVFEGVEVVDRSGEGSYPRELDAESNENPSVQETLLVPDQEERQLRGAVEKEPNEDADESTESDALEIDSVVSQQGTTDSDIVEGEMEAGPVNTESLSGEIDLIGNEQETVEAVHVDGLEPAEISSADTPTLGSEVAEADDVISNVIDGVGADDGLLSAEGADIDIQQTEMLDEEAVVTEVVEEVVESELKDSEAVDAAMGLQSTLEQFDQEPQIDELDTNGASGTQIRETTTEYTAEDEYVSANERTDGHYSDGADKPDLPTELEEESVDNPAFETDTTVHDVEAVKDERDEVETNTTEPVLPSRSEVGMLQRNESLDVEVSGSAENSTFSSEGQPEVVEEDLEPAGPSSIQLFQDADQSINVAPGGAMPLAELEAAEAGAASDPLDGHKENAPPGLFPAENKSIEEETETAASMEMAETAEEETFEEDPAIAEQVPIDLPVSNTKVTAAAGGEFDTSAYSAENMAEEATPQTVDVSDATLADGNTSKVIGNVQPSMSTEEKGLLNEIASYEPISAVDNVDQ